MAKICIPKGTYFIISPEIINQMKSLRGGDPEKFDRERFLKVGRANSGGAKSNYRCFLDLKESAPKRSGRALEATQPLHWCNVVHCRIILRVDHVLNLSGVLCTSTDKEARSSPRHP